MWPPYKNLKWHSRFDDLLWSPFFRKTVMIKFESSWSSIWILFLFLFSRDVFYKIPGQWTTSTFIGYVLDSSNVTWNESSIDRVLLLKILKLEVKYPKNRPSPPLTGNLQRLSFPLLITKHFTSKHVEVRNIRLPYYVLLIRSIF